MQIVIEMQNGIVLSTVYEEGHETEALQGFFQVCAAAAASQVTWHTVMLVDQAGNKIRDPEVFYHGNNATA